MASGGARSDVARVPPLSTIMGKSLGCSELSCLSVKWESHLSLSE